MRPSRSKSGDDVLAAGNGRDFLEYSQSLLTSLAQIAKLHHMSLYAHILGLATAEADLLLNESDNAKQADDARNVG